MANCVVSAIAEHRDGSVWIGTLDGGIYRLTGVDKALDGEMKVQHVKVPRNDGTGLADYLLADEQINDISVDSSGRKWIATERSGLFVVAPDGTEVIFNYTTGNSPLASNTVYNVYAQPSGRKIYVATPDGLLMHVSEMAPDSGKLESLHIYPNPVRPDYMGDVMIDGLTDGAVVTISSVSGNVVGRGRAEGGTFRWSPPASLAAGVYYVTAASPSGGSAVGKLVVIK